MGARWKIWGYVYMINDPRGAIWDAFIRRLRISGTGRVCPGSLHGHLIGRMKTQWSQLADFRNSCAKVHNIYRRRCRYQGTSTPWFSDWVPYTLLCRRSQPIVPSIPSLYIVISRWLYLEQISWLRKERNGRNTERLPLRLSQRYSLTPENHPSLIQSDVSWKIIN